MMEEVASQRVRHKKMGEDRALRIFTNWQCSRGHRENLESEAKNGYRSGDVVRCCQEAK